MGRGFQQSAAPAEYPSGRFALFASGPPRRQTGLGMIKDFGSYEIIKKIGIGGMATVYTARQKSLNRTVVLKTMHEHLQEDKTFVARFEREAKAAAAMSHENIVQIIDYGQEEGAWYIAMEHVDGSDLKKWLEQHGSPPVEIGTILLYDICAGLAHAHEHHVIHRDIKPANIMLAPTGVPKVADFGLAKQTQESTVLTVHDTMIGTVPYMSPEHATGQHVDERSDIFSLGVVAYELFGGRRPFPGNSSASVINAIITLDPLPLNNLNPLVTDELLVVVSKMLQKDPAKRYQSALAVRRDLELIIDDWGVTRSKEMLAEYLEEPEAVVGTFSKRRFKEHLNRGYQYKNMGLGKIDDAIKEFERAHFLDPDNAEAAKLLREMKEQKPQKKGGAKGTGKRGLQRIWIGIAASFAVVLLAVIFWTLLGGQPEDRHADRTAARRPATRPAVAPERTVPDEAPAIEVTEDLDGNAEDVAGQDETTAGGAEEETPAAATEPEPVAETPAPVLPAPEREAPPDRAVAAAAQVEPVVANGTLEITAKPTATFFVNDRIYAEDVSAVSLSFPPGEYEVRLENPFFGSTRWESVRVESEKTNSLAHDFAANAEGAFVTITTNRIPALIWIDGAPIGQWTPQRRISIEPGWHQITVKKEGYRVSEGEIEAAIHDGSTLELSFTLSKSE